MSVNINTFESENSYRFQNEYRGGLIGSVDTCMRIVTFGSALGSVTVSVFSAVSVSLVSHLSSEPDHTSGSMSEPLSFGTIFMSRSKFMSVVSMGMETIIKAENKNHEITTRIIIIQ